MQLPRDFDSERIQDITLWRTVKIEFKRSSEYLLSTPKKFENLTNLYVRYE